MLAEALCIGVEFVMSNHLYIFNKVARKQSKGGPIGLALTGDVAQVFMCYYDRDLIKKMEGLCLDVSQNLNVATSEITPISFI